MEKLIRSRSARITVALFLLGIGLWAFAPYLFHRISSAAFVNAELLRVTSPIQGQLTTALPQRGEFVASATTLSLVNSPTPDRRQLAIYEQEQNAAVTRIKLAVAQIKALNESDRELGTRIDSYRHAMLDRLGREMEEAKANLRACDARREELTKQRARIESLAKTGSVSKQRLEEVQSANTTANANCEAATARLDRLAGVTSAAKQGIFLQDGYNDTPYSQQQRDRLMLRKLELETDILREQARVEQLESDIANERQRVERTSTYELILPAGHVVWTITASPGAGVVEGQTIMDLANCKRRFIIVELPARDFESVKPGAPASVRLLGSDNWMSGTILQVLGSAAHQDERLLAAKVLRSAAQGITVEVGLESDSLSTDSGRYCDIGRMAEVHIERNRLDPLKLLDRITQSLGLSSIWTQAADESLEP